MRIIFFESNRDLFEEALKIRRKVFIEEQGVSEEDEMDGKDSEALHVLLETSGKFVGVARVRKIDRDTFKIERVAILKEERNKGYGRHLMKEIEKEIVTRGAKRIVLNAQVRVKGFYEKLGYTVVGDIFYEANIPHVKMVKVVGG
ncbi:GNAT family N-acetyltransferase [Thermotoga sp. KOL6]|uniref:GNAT family N-acetyltransferase n=1 Tax=Thermotoga sp. KOL6 TaxID=126741 RepID=UPI000C77639C|nr:GNAT family N-acetyltransferase [Thermotoga sp. KOL6]PLV60104.1 acetyltransferase [Thermotoga sp. KOL6]